MTVNPFLSTLQERMHISNTTEDMDLGDDSEEEVEQSRLSLQSGTSDMATD